MDDLILALLILGAASIPFILPIASWVSARRSRRRIDQLEAQLQTQERHIEALSQQLREVRAGSAAPVTESDAVAPPPAAVPSAADTRGDAKVSPYIERPAMLTPAAAPPAPAPPAAVPQSAAVPPPVAAAKGEAEASPHIERPTMLTPAAAPPARVTPPAADLPPRAAVPPPPAIVPPRLPSPPPPPEPPAQPFDWESLIGVKLFSAIAGIALVIATVFFLRYSIEHGWLQPPVRVAIGVLVAIALLVVCELKAARQYPATANALDAAAIAILFSTFFAAHALWNLIPATVAFALLALVTAIAVLLSIRRESLFIAVLGLLGGFATPALLSTGENRPIPLFAYLLLLNIGLSWVAYTKRWALLTMLTLIFTTFYQWGWVIKFLHESPLSLAASIFILFPIVTIVALLIARPAPPDAHADSSDVTFERTALVASALPLLFALYLATTAGYGAHPGILFGLLFLVDAGLLAVGLARREELLHAVSAVATLLVFGVWISFSYAAAAHTTVLLLLLVFVPFFALAPMIADRAGRPFSGVAARAVYAAPLLLVVPAALAGTERGGTSPVALFGVLFVLIALIAWRAIATEDGPLYFIAAFFGIASQAHWSAEHLTIERLEFAIGLYAVFGLLSFAVPIAARRADRPLTPIAGPGVVLLASLVLLLFLAAGPTAAAALWGLALLLAILNAGLFVESAASRLPALSLVGSALSWVVLASWWARSAAIVGVLPSLLVMTLLALVMFAGHAWSYAQARKDGEASPAQGFRSGLFLGLVAHLFLLYVAATPAWSVPPWPLFATLAVLTLAASTTALYTRVPLLHACAVVGTLAVVLEWTLNVDAAPWPTVAVLAGAVGTAYALAWIRVVRGARAVPIGAGVALFFFVFIVIAAAHQTGAPLLAVIVAAYVVAFAALLALTWTQQWLWVTPGAVIAAWIAVFSWQVDHDQAWRGLLVLAGALYVVFTAYPFILGRRARESRDPHLTAVLGAALFFFAARHAFTVGGLAWMMGAIPVFEGAVLALLLRQLLAIEPTGARDLTRLALVAGAALGFVTVAIPLQLSHQWITIGWALEGAALAWLFRRIPHRGLLWSAVALLAVVFVRLALNPEVFRYEPRGSLRVFNWYLYTYVACAASNFFAAWSLGETNDRLGIRDWRVMHLLSSAGAILLFYVLNIEIADFYAAGPEIMFRFGVSVAQDLTYTIGWLVFGMVMLACGIYLKSHAARAASLALIAITTFKAFLYDLGSLGGLYRVGSLVGLAVSLTLVSLALQRFVLRPAKEPR